MPDPKPLVTQVAVLPPALTPPGPSSTRIPFSNEISPEFTWLMSKDAHDVPPSIVVATTPPSITPAVSTVATSHLTPRRSILSSPPLATRLSPAATLTNRRTPVSPSAFPARRPSRGLSPAPIQAHSALAVAVGWDQATQDALDTPIEEEDHRLDVDMGDYGYMDNGDTSGSTLLRRPAMDDERPPPGTPTWEDMELDVNVLEEGDAPVPPTPIQAPAPVPAPVANVSLATKVVETT